MSSKLLCCGGNIERWLLPGRPILRAILGDMKVLRRFLCLLLMGLGLVAVALPVSAQSGSGKVHLVAFPPVAARDGYFYLSGSGLAPKTPVTLTMGCPDVIAPGRIIYGVWTYNAATRPDGTMLAVKIPIQKLLVIPANEGTWCRIHVNVGVNALGPWARVYILPQGATVAPRFPLNVSVKPVSDRSGTNEVVRVKNFIPGAKLTFKESFGTEVKDQYTKTMPWSGNLQMRRPIPQHIDHGGRVKVVVKIHGQLGDFYGDATVTWWVQARRG
jgi:hypothetical protein